MKKPLSAKKLDRLIELTYYKFGQGVQINIMDITKVFAAGRTAYLNAFAVQAGTEVQAVEGAIIEAIARLRTN